MASSPSLPKVPKATASSQPDEIDDVWHADYVFFILYDVPSGLLIYWITNNVLYYPPADTLSTIL